jgi:hypothetical protein
MLEKYKSDTPHHAKRQKHCGCKHEALSLRHADIRHTAFQYHYEQRIEDINGKKADLRETDKESYITDAYFFPSIILNIRFL